MAALAILGLLFRAAFYWMIPVFTGETAGAGDVIEVLVYFGIFGLAVATMAIGALLLVIPYWRNVRLAIKVLVVSLVASPTCWVLYSFVPRLVH